MIRETFQVTKDLSSWASWNDRDECFHTVLNFPSEMLYCAKPRERDAPSQAYR